ncbi:hypothetical protein ACFQ6Q_04320 [Streptomyces sp. NPDC056437]|uniref:hypothetical protein n=1 Tax=Streptomyces sp. NPDC056437 TaxID=3345816 RepID=UPI0036C78BE8
MTDLTCRYCGDTDGPWEQKPEGPWCEGCLPHRGLKRIDTPRSHYYKLDGRRVTGVTTLINGGIPKPNLIDWAARVVAEYVADNPAEIASLRGAGRRQLVDFLKVRHNAIRDKAGARGTDVHTYAQRFLSGEDNLTVPDELLGYVEACVAFLDEWQVLPVLVETAVASRAWQYCGTFDVVGDVYDGTRRIVDWKTGASGIWGETGLQLAGYANAEFYHHDDGTEHQMADLSIDKGLAVHLKPDGTYDAFDTVIDATAFKKFQHVAAVARLAKTLKADLIGPVLPRPNASQENAA